MAATMRGALLCAFTLLFICGATAFDTGHHSDITYNALLNRGFGDDAISLAQLQNFMADHLSNDFLLPKLKADMQYAHFDNLIDHKRVKSYWNILMHNLKNATEEEASNDPIRVITLIGVALHAVQDFYSHSNWAELFGPGDDQCYETYLGYKNAADVDDLDLLTGVYSGTKPSDIHGSHPEHGGYTCGVNKDSYVKPRWLVSDRYAYFASYELLGAIESWITAKDAGAWDNILDWTASGDEGDWLSEGLIHARLLSMYSKTFSEDANNGHWKGSGSGDKSTFFKEAAAMEASDFFRDSSFVSLLTDDKIHRKITDGLGDVADDTVDFNFTDTDHRNVTEIFVRVLSAKDLARADGSDGTADMFTRITIEGREYIDSIQLDDSNVNWFWQTPRIFETVPGNTVSITIELLDSDPKDYDSNPDADEPLDTLDINPTVGQTSLTLTYSLLTGELTGDVTGLHDSVDNAAEASGTASEGAPSFAKIRFFVTHRSLANCFKEPLDEPFDKWPSCNTDDGWSTLQIVGAAVAAVVIVAVFVSLCVRWYNRRKAANKTASQEQLNNSASIQFAPTVDRVSQPV